MALQIGVPREVFPGEKRVATVPEVVEKLVKQGFRVAVEAGAGDGCADQRRRVPRRRRRGRRRSRRRCGRRPTSCSRCARPTTPRVALLREGGMLVSFIWPAQNPELMQKLAARKATVLAMDSVPRISRAQKLDALSSMANIGGYRAVIEAAHAFGRFFTGSDHGRGQGAAGEGVRHRRRRRGPRGDRRGRRASARSCAPTTRGPRSPTRSSRWAASSCRSTTRRKAAASAATRR